MDNKTQAIAGNNEKKRDREREKKKLEQNDENSDKTK